MVSPEPDRFQAGDPLDKASRRLEELAGPPRVGPPLDRPTTGPGDDVGAQLRAAGEALGSAIALAMFKGCAQALLAAGRLAPALDTNGAPLEHLTGDGPRRLYLLDLELEPEPEPEPLTCRWCHLPLEPNGHTPSATDNGYDHLAGINKGRAPCEPDMQSCLGTPIPNRPG